MDPSFIDHLLMGASYVVVPLYSWLTYAKWQRDVAERGEPARIEGYRETVLIWVALTVATVVAWLWQGRTLQELGLGVRTGDQLWWAIGTTILVLGALGLQWRTLTSGKVKLTEKDLGSVATLIPRTKRERRWARLTAVNAGITEEIVLRGFSLAYLQAFFGLWPAVVISSFLFAAAHGYQGVSKLPAILVAGLLFALLAVWSGTLWLPILVHAVADWLQIDGASRALVGDTDESPTEAEER